MSRLHSQSAADATGHTAALFSGIRKAIGRVPNAYADIGANSPLALEAMLALDGAIAKGSLSKQEIELVKLTVSQENGCDYCVAAHTFVGRHVGLDQASILGARFGGPIHHPRHEALTRFVREIVRTQGTVPATHVDALKNAGYSDQQVVDTLLVVASITFTNAFNRVNDTTLDFPAVD
ncbi:MAG: alkylhydroperoxidase [Rhodanobacter denitrificans]|uniref:Alkylhydroperoxidase n=1 Tax=Rhodanobacter denitrificans TaxID=666685 RepID=A0A2W5MEL5_9GAMM|nr:MAG: alkylhydroperoxidase [Rhodanobacter denitrificans]